jgi:hypothetical protein
MPSSGTLHLVALVRTGVLEEGIASIIRITKIGEIGITLAVTSNRRMMLIISCHPDDGGFIFLQNIGSYRSRMT